MKQMEVTIMGQSYILGCPDGGQASLLSAVAAVDREMCAIRDAGKVKARERIAVLAALNLAYQLAERPAPNNAASSQPSTPPTSDLGHEAQLERLAARLDEALRDDDRLL